MTRKRPEHLYPKARIHCLLLHQVVWEKDDESKNIYYCPMCERVFREIRNTNMSVKNG